MVVTGPSPFWFRVEKEPVDVRIGLVFLFYLFPSATRVVSFPTSYISVGYTFFCAFLNPSYVISFTVVFLRLPLLPPRSFFPAHICIS